MTKRRRPNDYVPVKRSQSQRANEIAVTPDPASRKRHRTANSALLVATDATGDSHHKDGTQERLSATMLKRGHLFTYTALFLFTIILYARPAEFYPSSLTMSLALIAGLVTLALFLTTQIALEGTLTAWLPEVKLLLLFVVTGALSIPFAIDPAQAWSEFGGAFIRAAVICVVIVNVVRTEKRLKGLLILTIITALCLSVGAINDYRLGLMTVEGYRVGGRGSGIFGNSNDMALFLVTIIPVTIAMALDHRGRIGKVVLGACAVLLTGAVVLTYSRGAFIGLILALAFLTWKTGSRNKGVILVIGFVSIAAFLLLAPGGYMLRLASIFVPSLDPVGSADARRGELLRSLYVALRHPAFGIGMGNYAPNMSYHGLVTHNSYTQVASEMGIAALVCYIMFIVSPFRKLGQVARETFAKASDSHFHYLALGLQASILGYLVCSFFASVAYLWYVYYLVGYAVCLRRLYESDTGKEVLVKTRKAEKKPKALHPSVLVDKHGAVIA